jgi:hypothetical protein
MRGIGNMWNDFVAFLSVFRNRPTNRSRKTNEAYMKWLYISFEDFRWLDIDSRTGNLKTTLNTVEKMI